MILLELPVLLGVIPLTVLLAVCLPARYRLPVLTAGGLAALWLACGVRGLILTLCSVCAGWLCLRLQTPRSQNRRAALLWLAAGTAIQAVLLLLGRIFISAPSQRIPLLLCIMQAIGCIKARCSGRLAVQPLTAYLHYQCALPRLTGGPVLSFPQAAEIARKRRADVRLAGSGGLHFTAGLVQLSLLAAPLFSMHRQMTEARAAVSSFDTWLLLIVFYCAAYYAVRGAAELCRGIAALTGYRVPPQSDTPLLARTPRDFCARWYRSAADWCKVVLLRDGLPLDNTAYFARTLPFLCGIGMLLGRGWATGLLWGAFTALLLTAERTLRRRSVRPAAGVSRFLTGALMLLSCCFLQAQTLTDSFSAVAGLLGKNGILPSGRAVYAFRNHWLPLLAAVIGLLPLRPALRRLLQRKKLLARAAYGLIPLAEAALLLLCLTELIAGRLRGF